MYMRKKDKPMSLCINGVTNVLGHVIGPCEDTEATSETIPTLKNIF